MRTNVSQSQKEKQEKRERQLVLEFLKHASLTYVAPDIRSIPPPGPDVKVTCLIDGRPTKIGIEVVEYQVDAQANGGSRARAINRLWRKIYEFLSPQLASDASIRECDGFVSFDAKCSPNRKDAKSLADQLVKFLRNHVDILPTTPESGRTFSRTSKRPHDPGDFDQYSLLSKYFTRLLLSRQINLVGPLSWSYNSAAMVGVDEKKVVDLINDKAKKLPGYDRCGTAETWLLICAGVSIPHDSAGTKDAAEPYLNALPVRAAAQGSGFDRVEFWDRAHRWNVRLK